MKYQIVFIINAALLLAVVWSAPDDVDIVKSSSDVGPEGYTFDLETSDGTVRHEEGKLSDVGNELPAMKVKGSYSWKDKDGKTFEVNFVADEFGYHPVGDHLPHIPEPQIKI